MVDTNQFALPYWREAFHAVRRHRAASFASLKNLSHSLPDSDLPIWIVTIMATLVCTALVGLQGRHYLVILAAIAASALISSIAGFAFSAICGAMLFHLTDDPVKVVQLMITCSIANQVAMTWALRHEIFWSKLSVYLSGGMLGLGFGVWFLIYADQALYMHVIGCILLVYGGYMLFRPPLIFRRQPVIVDFGSGFVGGLTGGAAATPGFPVAIWCSMKGWDKTRQRAVFQPFILIMQIVALLLIALARRSNSGDIGFDLTNLLFIPASLLGTWLGLGLFARLSDKQFARAVNIMLMVSGASFVV